MLVSSAAALATFVGVWAFIAGYTLGEHQATPRASRGPWARPDLLFTVLLLGPFAAGLAAVVVGVLIDTV